MLEWAKHALQWLKESPRYLLPITLFCAFVLFAPEAFIRTLGLLIWREQGQPYFGAAFALTGLVILNGIAFRVAAWIRKKHERFLRSRQRRRRLHHLTPHEKEILRRYIEGQTKTLALDIGDGIVSGLISAEIIYRASNVGDWTEFAHNIQPWAWDYLKEHPELLRADH